MFISNINGSTNTSVLILVNLLIFILILLVAPMLFSLFSGLIKPKINKGKLIYLYAFSTGMFIIIGAVGFMKESFVSLEQFMHTAKGLKLTGGSVIKEQSYLALIIGISSLIGFIFVIGWRFISVKLSREEIHGNHEEHGHSDHIISIIEIDNPKQAWAAILMLLSHRIIDGLVLGYGVYQFVDANSTKPNIALIVTFNLHILVESLIIYYRQIQYGQTRWKAIMYNFITMLLIVPIMFLGAYTGSFLDKTQWLVPAMQVLAGSIIIFTAVFELVPEFIHARNAKPKVLYCTFITFSLGIVLTLAMLSFHSHNIPAQVVGLPIAENLLNLNFKY
ncbi:ZIP family metal transporter [[Mycoplasma] gypis]|uniref:ZIP family metal transporter n=1 Tax=[Mycoplasma] gypis TaxID=92404 RepID=A0ABZ2RQ89_9BACT|nr:ZIP family metal transporter [[Mycoplasma] gypis]MBN0919484.1 ZIP family metal transporter [[Mycoplasma] gypis]